MMESSELKLENWHNLNINDKSYLFKCLFHDDNYELLVFNLIECKLYYEKKSKADIEHHLRKYNASIEAPINKICSHLKSCLTTDSESCEFNDKKHGNDLVISMVSKLAGIKFNWRFDLDSLDLDALKEHLVLPLIYNCFEYQLREKELFKILQSKDKEIEDYKEQGVKLTRKYLETEVFSKDAFNTIMNKRKTDDLKQPEEALYSQSGHIIQNSCSSKYYKKMKQQNDYASNIDMSQSEEKTPKKSQERDEKKTKDTPKSSEKETSRLEALRQQLKEEEAKKQTQQKKKKLF